MFSLAVKSGIPIISVQTTDTVNVQAVIQELTGETALEAPDKPGSLVSHPSCRVFWTLKAPDCDANLYANLISHGKCLVVVNHPDPGDLVFSAGVLPVPKSLLRQVLKEIIPEDEIDGLLPCFSGLTLKDFGEVARLTMVRDNSLTPKGILHTRALLVTKTQGLQQVDTDLGVYLPHEPLEAWVKLNEPYFTNPPDPRLTPRGVLLNGPPGTGKSQSAKYFANQWKVPLYRLDLTSALGKYVGESESQFNRILGILDQEQPSIVLLDEVEKLFTQASDTGVTYRLLSQLLWWLQEHTSRVFVVMTTNDLSAIPSEMYRGRRIDKVFDIQKLGVDEALVLASSIVQSFKTTISSHEKKQINQCVKNYTNGQEDRSISHAQVTQLMYDLIKQNHWF